MPSFTKTQMIDEFRIICLYEADHLLMLGRGKSDFAEAVIGFGPGDENEYLNHDITDVDLSRFPIASSFERGYDFAFCPSVANTLGEDEVQDLIVFMYGTPRVGGIASGGEMHRYMTPDGFCQTVADAVNARWKLEWDSPSGHTFTTRDLSLLADMTEGAVRNAIADKSEARLQSIPGSKNPVLVEHAEALRWLKGRRGFIPFPDRPLDDRFLRQQLHATGTTEALGRLIGQRLWTIDVPSVLGWSAPEVEAWVAGTQDFDVVKAQVLAEALDLDVPLFVGKALEVTFRRDHDGGAA